MRWTSAGHWSIGLTAALGVLVGLSACAPDDDGAGIGSSSVKVEGLVEAPAEVPPIVSQLLVEPTATAGTRVNLVAYVAPPAANPAPSLSPADVDLQAGRLRQTMDAEVPNAIDLSPIRQEALITLGQEMAAEDHLFIQQPQLVLIVDRAPQGQLLAMTLARPDGTWEILGTRHVSTGKPGRLQHFKTPVGVLLNDGSELGYRAQGTFNQFHIRGLGVKGMRVWDFGWQTGDDWRTPGATMVVRVEMHATDPDVLEQRIGRPDSEGCIRLPDALNRFLDRHGIIDAAILRLGETDGGYRASLSPERDPTPLAGDAVIVVDSSDPWVRPYPPETSVALSD